MLVREDTEQKRHHTYSLRTDFYIKCRLCSSYPEFVYLIYCVSLAISWSMCFHIDELEI